MITKVKKSWQIGVDLFHDYSDHSTIHGIIYLTEKRRSWFERIWWIAAIFVSVLCCGKLIFDAWSIDPIIITFTDKPTPIWKVNYLCCCRLFEPKLRVFEPKLCFFYPKLRVFENRHLAAKIRFFSFLGVILGF
jgi:Amiloride-sensitive sodium channel